MTVPPSQDAAAAFLQDLAGSPPVETHISLVFRGAGTVWKLKKAVRLPFLDFTQLPDRRHFAERELALNAPAAPGLYRDVVPILRRPDGTLTLDPTPGLPVEDWVVRMARVPDHDFLDVMAAEGRIDAALLDAIADSVAAYHQTLPPVPDVLPPMRDIALGNVCSARAAGLPDETVDAWETAVLASLDQRKTWLKTRADEGFVRRAHGDLHLGNLCLWHGQPVPFDALEFDETLATIDLAYDLAFLLMDLDHRLNRGAANRVMNRYVARTGDAGLVAGLPVFLSIRAMVRAHVEARSGHTDAVASYLEAALAYLNRPPPVVIGIGGLPGTGKSTIARRLAPQIGGAPGALVLRSDEIRKRQWGVAPEHRLSQDAYTPAASTAVFDALAEAAFVAASGGHAVIADATFINPAHRAQLAAAAARAEVKFIGLWLEAPIADLEARVSARSGDASDATVAVLRSAAQANPGAGDWTAIDTSVAETGWHLVMTAVSAHLVTCWKRSPEMR
jgi:aminoglycoside phosphotransferase family enzyme/predicted kinase